MKWGRYIKRTAVRRVVWIVVGLVVYALLSVLGVARAAVHDMEGEAYQACMAAAQAAADYLTGYENPRCVFLGGAPSACRYRAYVTRISNGADYYIGQLSGHGQDGDHIYSCNNSCDSRQTREFNRNTSLWGAPPAQACVTGCTYNRDPSQDLCTLVEEGPTAGYWCNMVFSPTGGTCTDGPDPGDGEGPPRECSADEVRLPDGSCSPKGQCPVGQHEVNGECHPSGRCPTGHVKAPDGSCAPESCPAGQARGADGTCKADGNEDGTPDEDEEGGEGTNTDGMEFSGGESCEVPPTCSGDAIMCGQARIQWRIDCNTRRNTSGHGGMSCGVADMPVCVGEHCDWTEHQQLIQQWKSACALAELAQGDGVGGGDMSGVEDRLDGIASFLDGDGDCLASPGGCGPGDGDLWDEEAPESESWSSGLPSTGSCPAPISTTITIGDHSTPIEFSYQPICDFAALMRWVLIAAATIMSGFIVAGVRNS